MAALNVVATSEAHYAKPKSVASLERAYQAKEVVLQRQKTIEMLHLMEGEVVLDLGCGPGQLSSELAAAVGGGGAVYGVDTSPAMISRAKERYSASQKSASEIVDVVKEFDVAGGAHSSMRCRYLTRGCF